MTSYGYISYKGVLYPVPTLKKVSIENVFGRYLYIYDEKGLSHRQSMDKKGTIPHPEHEMTNRAYMDKKELNRRTLIEALS